MRFTETFHNVQRTRLNCEYGFRKENSSCVTNITGFMEPDNYTIEQISSRMAFDIPRGRRDLVDEYEKRVEQCNKRMTLGSAITKIRKARLTRHK